MVPQIFDRILGGGVVVPLIFPKVGKLLLSCVSKWWQLKYFFKIFAPNLGEDEPNFDLSIFFRSVGSTTNQIELEPETSLVLFVRAVQGRPQKQLYRALTPGNLLKAIHRGYNQGLVSEEKMASIPFFQKITKKSVGLILFPYEAIFFDQHWLGSNDMHGRFSNCKHDFSVH